MGFFRSKQPGSFSHTAIVNGRRNFYAQVRSSFPDADTLRVIFDLKPEAFWVHDAVAEAFGDDVIQPTSPNIDKGEELVVVLKGQDIETFKDGLEAYKNNTLLMLSRKRNDFTLD